MSFDATLGYPGEGPELHFDEFEIGDPEGFGDIDDRIAIEEEMLAADQAAQEAEQARHSWQHSFDHEQEAKDEQGHQAQAEAPVAAVVAGRPGEGAAFQEEATAAAGTADAGGTGEAAEAEWTVVGPTRAKAKGKQRRPPRAASTLQAGQQQQAPHPSLSLGGFGLLTLNGNCWATAKEVLMQVGPPSSHRAGARD